MEGTTKNSKNSEKKVGLVVQNMNIIHTPKFNQAACTSNSTIYLSNLKSEIDSWHKQSFLFILHTLE